MFAPSYARLVITAAGHGTLMTIAAIVGVMAVVVKAAAVGVRVSVRCGEIGGIVVAVVAAVVVAR